MLRVKEVSCGVKQGDVLGGRTVLGCPFGIGIDWLVVCQCECGQIAICRTCDLVHGKNVRCSPCAMKFRRLHGLGGTRIYNLWNAMVQRCHNSSSSNYKNYGGRGIAVCEEWRWSAVAFKAWAIANGYEDHLQIDRIDNDGNYEPSNCRWVTRQANCMNKSNNHPLTAFGETKNLSDWARDPRCKVSLATLGRRVNSGIDPETAMTMPPKGKKKT